MAEFRLVAHEEIPVERRERASRLTGSALGLLLTLGTVNNASAGHDGYGYAPNHVYGAHHGYHGAYGMPGHYGYGGYSRAPMKGYIQHPVMGYPVPMTHGHGYGNPHGKDGSCGSYQKSGYTARGYI